MAGRSTYFIVCLENVRQELVTQGTELNGAVVRYVKSVKISWCTQETPSLIQSWTDLGSKKSSLRSRSSPYPNLRRTVQVVSIRPCWINIVWRYRKPSSVIPSPAGDMSGGVECNWPYEASRGIGVGGVEYVGTGKTATGSYERTISRIRSTS